MDGRLLLKKKKIVHSSSLDCAIVSVSWIEEHEAQRIYHNS